MLEKIDLKAVPEVVLAKTFDFLNTSSSALEIAEMTARHSDFIQGVATGEKVAASILLMRDKVGGAFTLLSQLQGVAYFTEDKVKTLLAVFYLETGVWELPGDQSKFLAPVLEPIAMPLEEMKAVPMVEPINTAPLPEPILMVDPVFVPLEKPTLLDPQVFQAVDPKLSTSLTSPTLLDARGLPLLEPTLSGEGELIKGEGDLGGGGFIKGDGGSSGGGGVVGGGDVSGGGDGGGDVSGGGDIVSGGGVVSGGGMIVGDGSGLLGGKQVLAELVLSGRLANTSPKVSFKGYSNELSFLAASPQGNGKWKLLFKTNFNAGTPSVALRLDLEERGSHVLAVSALWNPQNAAPIVVSL